MTTLTRLFLSGAIALAMAPGASTQFQPVPFAGNPVLPRGAPGSWDSGFAGLTCTVQVGGVYHMFYTGSVAIGAMPSGIGLATSTDGVHFTKYSGNPILSGDGTGFDAYSIANCAVLYENGTWVLYYGAWDGPSTRYGPSRAIGRATGPSPVGPWTRSANPVLAAASTGEWDSAWISPDSVVRTAGEYRFYYSAGAGAFQSTEHAIGMARSADGISWNKYDDPATPSAPYGQSDPVFRSDPAGWDSNWVDLPSVLYDGTRYEMFYRGLGPSSEGIGYAASADGLSWTRCSAGPFNPVEPWHIEATKPDVIRSGTEYRLYYTAFSTFTNAAVGLASSVAAFGSFGTGCTGAGGITPVLTAGGCPLAGGRVDFSLRDGPGSALALAVFGSNQGSVPLPGGCSLLAQPLLPGSRLLSLSGSGPGGGTGMISLPVPAGLLPFTLTSQWFALQPTAPRGYVASNGVFAIIP